MSRRLVGAIFALFTVATVAQALPAAEEAVAHPTLRACLVAGFWVMKLGVVAAFSYFVMVRPESERRARSPLAFGACAAAILGAAALQPPAGEGSTTLLLAGEAVALLSGAWLLASVLALGRCFGVLPEARGLVTRGPYRLVRHPVYLGELGACGGLVLAAPSGWNLGAAALMLAGQLVRLRLEERALTHAFPEYAAYAARTPRLIPSARRRPRPLSTPAPAPGSAATS